MYDKLKQVLGQEDTVLFVGAGISIWSGLPSWSMLIEELAQFIENQSYPADIVRAEAAKGDLLQAASYGFDKLTQQQIGEFIRGSSRCGKAQPHEIHRKIIKLGPRCFITTNYDSLIEDSLRRWEPDRFQSIVTNRQLTETAEIIQARALDFVFKPHGDAGDSDSIILTREQYRKLLPNGERHNALETVKMLLASRPIVYLGFGLRDPDFLYIRDLLANTYKGGNRDHYAIMADVSEAEIDYWRRNYGIHFIPYVTTERPDKSRDHSPLLALLDQLLPTNPLPIDGTEIATTAISSKQNSSLLLSLARHAARLMRVSKVNPEFPLHVRYTGDSRSSMLSNSFRIDKFDYSPITQFLDGGPKRTVIIGLPGAGKSYALQQATARCAEHLHELCLLEPCPLDKLVIPIFVDLKLYRGNVWDLIEKTLPPGLSLESAVQQFQLKFFLDSFNEMPREYWESGAYEEDFSKFISQIGESSLVIGSRTTDGLSKLGLPFYSLDQIDEKFVREELKQRGITFDGRFEQDVLRLLVKPFYFQLVSNGTVQLKQDTHPRDIFNSFFLNLSNDFQSRFNIAFDLEQALSLCGYEALNRGEEAQTLISFAQTLTNQLQATGITQISTTDLVNWLVAKSVLIPYSGARIAFFHQSVTEFLAAQELARRYQTTPYILKEKIALMRWDQTLFLTLSLLQPDIAKMFLKDIIELDLSLALNAVRFLEIDRDAAVAELLDAIIQRSNLQDRFAFDFSWPLKLIIPVNESHENQLRVIMNIGNSLGAAAAIRLFEMKGIDVKSELIETMHARYYDFNYCTIVGRSLHMHMSATDIPDLIKLVDSLEEVPASGIGEEHPAYGFIAGVAEAIKKIELSAIAIAFANSSGEHILIRSLILCNVLRDHSSTEALEIAADLLLRNVDQAVFSIYMLSQHGNSERPLSWAKFGLNHMVKLVELLSNEHYGEWALSDILILCDNNPALSEYIVYRSESSNGLLCAALRYAVDPTNNLPVFEALQNMVDEPGANDDYAYLLRGMELNWSGHEQLFIQLLRSRSVAFAWHLLESQLHDSTLGELNIGPIDWWLDWLENIDNDQAKMWIEDRLSSIFTNSLKAEDQRAFVVEFNKKNSPHRRTLAKTILLKQKNLSTDNFSEDAISFLLASLSTESGIHPFHGHLLGHTATENFVVERLLPLLSQATGNLKNNLHQILRQAGSRHSRRYIGI